MPVAPASLQTSGREVATVRDPWSEIGVSWETGLVGGKDVLQKQSEGEGLQVGGHREVPTAHVGLKHHASVIQGEGQRQSKQRATGERRERWVDS